MNKDSNFSLVLSLSELAWIAVFFAILLYAQERVKSKGHEPDQAELPIASQTLFSEKTPSNKVESLNSLKTPETPEVDTATSYLKRIQASNHANSNLTRQYSEMASNYEKLFYSTSEKLNQLQHSLNAANLSSNKLFLEREVLSNTAVVLKEELASTLHSATASIVTAPKTGLTVSNLSLREKHLRQELIGLKGRFHSVVFVVDLSASMSEEGRWNYASGVMKEWLSLLPVNQCAIVTFNDRIQVFPSDGNLLNIEGEEFESNRRLILDWLNQAKPGGYTDTLSALRRAYSYTNADTIVLFSDGNPTLPPPRNGARESRKLAKEVIALCQSQSTIRGVPVNAVALGDYFQEDFGAFLKQIAASTGGGFVGR